jgi:hypothetical protein
MRKNKLIPCEVCGWKLTTCDKHRMKPGKDGGTYESGNVLILCPNCHRLAHHGVRKTTMAKRYLMSWDGAPYFRWNKMYRGTRYRVTCQELGAMLFTQEGSYKLANAWWEKKLAEVSGLTISFYKVDAEPENVVVINEIAARRGVSPPTPRKPLTIKNAVAMYLNFIRGDSKPGTFRELRNTYAIIARELGEDTDVSSIDEEMVERVYLSLKNSGYTPGTRKKRYGFFKRLVRYLYTRKYLELPRNLHESKFRVPTTAVKEYDLAEVRKVLDGLRPRLRLYAMLGLNCGMTAVDIGALTHSMIVDGVLTRKRVKTEGQETVPTVSYVLWPETLELIEQFRSSHPTLVLTTSTGTPLVEYRQEGDQTPCKDMIGKMWRRHKVPIPLSAFRSISATALESHDIFSRHTDRFLGHSEKDFKLKWYAAPAGESFEAAMVWLRGKVLGVSPSA